MAMAMVQSLPALGMGWGMVKAAPIAPTLQRRARGPR